MSLIRAYIGLGSNLGNRLRNLERGLFALKNLDKLYP